MRRSLLAFVVGALLASPSLAAVPAFLMFYLGLRALARKPGAD